MSQLALTWKVAEDERSHRKDIQLCLNIQSLTLLFRKHCGKTIVKELLANDVLKEASRRHIRQAGTQLDKEKDDGETDGNEKWGFELEVVARTNLPVLSDRNLRHVAGVVVEEEASIASQLGADAARVRVGR